VIDEHEDACGKRRFVFWGWSKCWAMFELLKHLHGMSFLKEGAFGSSG
jgi:hypothetical protein